jgi:DNA-binding XRE family transcriptional regulator
MRSKKVRFDGRIWKDGEFWLVEIPLLNAMTQGRTKKEAYEMAADLVKTLVDVKGFTVKVHPSQGNSFELNSNNPKLMLALMLKRQRQRHGLSLAQVAQKLKASSRNSYARYEQGRAMPTVEKLAELLRAVSDTDLVIRQSEAG